MVTGMSASRRDIGRVALHCVGVSAVLVSLVAAMTTNVAAADPPPPADPGTSTGDGPVHDNSGGYEGDGNPDGFRDNNDNGIDDRDEEPPGGSEGAPAPRVAPPRGGGRASPVSPVRHRPHSTVSAQTVVIRRDSTTPPAVEPPHIVQPAPADNPAPRADEHSVHVEPPAQRIEVDAKNLRSPFSVELSETTINPGGHVMATGFGCGPTAPVTLTVGQSAVVSTVADQKGTFVVALATDSLGIGHHDVKADCGKTKEIALDVVLVSRVGTGAATTTLILIFMVSGIWYFGRRILFPTELRSRNV
jgi:hypothetical protein